jgi:hypothetical protein
MTVKYSASARGFFDTALHRAIPEDAEPVSASRYAALLAGQAEGHEIVPDKRGRPQLRQLASTTLEQTRAACVHAIKREAARRINERMPIWRQLNALRDNSDPGFHKIDAIRAASDLIEEQLADAETLDAIAAFPVRDHPLWPDFDNSEIDS